MASWAFHKKKLHCRHATGNCRPMEAYLKLVRSIPAYAREDAAHLEGVENLPWRCAHSRMERGHLRIQNERERGNCRHARAIVDPWKPI